jgi:hypothetical protein
VIRRRRLPEGVVATPALRRAADHWQRQVLAMDAAGPALTETVRLRAAAHHDCLT